MHAPRLPFVSHIPIRCHATSQANKMTSRPPTPTPPMSNGRADHLQTLFDQLPRRPGWRTEIAMLTALNAISSADMSDISGSDDPVRPRELSQLYRKRNYWLDAANIVRERQKHRGADHHVWRKGPPGLSESKKLSLELDFLASTCRPAIDAQLALRNSAEFRLLRAFMESVYICCGTNHGGH